MACCQSPVGCSFFMLLIDADLLFAALCSYMYGLACLLFLCATCFFSICYTGHLEVVYVQLSHQHTSSCYLLLLIKPSTIIPDHIPQSRITAPTPVLLQTFTLRVTIPQSFFHRLCIAHSASQLLLPVNISSPCIPNAFPPYRHHPCDSMSSSLHDSE